MTEESALLEHESDAASLGSEVRHVLSGKKNSSGVGGFQSGDHAQEGGLAATTRTDECEQFTTSKNEIDTVDDRAITDRAAESLDAQRLRVGSAHDTTSAPRSRATRSAPTEIIPATIMASEGTAA